MRHFPLNIQYYYQFNNPKNILFYLGIFSKNDTIQAVTRESIKFITYLKPLKYIFYIKFLTV